MTSTISPSSIRTAQQWTESVDSRAFCLNDLFIMQEGEQIEFVVLDRNVWDVIYGIYGTDPHVGEHTVRHFFRANRALYTRGSEFTNGTMIFFLSERGVEEEKKQNIVVHENFQWHPYLQEAKMWYPVNDAGAIPSVDDFGRRLPHAGTHISDLPPSTMLGWRGQCIPVSRIPPDEIIRWEGFPSSQL